MKITAVEQELLLPEIRAFAAALHDPAARARYQQLHAAVEDGEVEDELAGHLANVLEVGLLNGRLRRLYGADGEQALTKVFQRTPAGATLSADAAAVTKALAALQGHVINEVKLSATGPGSYSITIDTDRCQLSVRLDRGGARVHSVEIGV